MTNPMFNPQPNYSGVTIQIANPSVYAGGVNPSGVNDRVGFAATGLASAGAIGTNPAVNSGYGSPYANCAGMNPYYNPVYNSGYVTNPEAQNQTPYQLQQAYPPQYYLNNYNYQNNGVDTKDNPAKLLSDLQKQNAEQPQVEVIESGLMPEENQAIKNQDADSVKAVKQYEVKEEEPQDFTKSQAVIDDLDARAAAAEAEKKNSKQKRVVALTDEYIKSLENYLNNPNDEIRLMASKEILTRLDEDKDRFDDAALNALLNKMLQDPSKLIRVAALSAFASQLASGNDYTITLLQNIQQNQSADKEDVLQAADILLKMSAGTEIKNIPNPAVKAEDGNNNEGQKQ